MENSLLVVGSISVKSVSSAWLLFFSVQVDSSVVPTEINPLNRYSLGIYHVLSIVLNIVDISEQNIISGPKIFTFYVLGKKENSMIYN